MMFNGLLMCGDSDTSDFTKASGASSLPDAGSGSWDGSGATNYHQQLMATLQVLANKEETVRVQAESLRVAEARIAALTARAQRLRAERDERAAELKALQESIDRNRPQMTDISMTTDTQEVENQKKVVKTLQTNLSVIEDLYRECFYETAKQEELIEMLRKSYLDVRLMDKERCDQLGRLQNVVNAQRCSLERCQDVALEVEGLKMEISNFLNNSNNDSGMWERSEDSLGGEVTEDLRQITTQLLQLRAMLTGDCTCGLEEENTRLKQLNETMQIEAGELRQRVSELEATLVDRHVVDQTLRDEMAEKDRELNSVRRRLAELEDSAGNDIGCESAAEQLQMAQASIEEQTRELVEARRRCQGHEEAITRLREELEKANSIIEEGRAMRARACAGAERARALAAELARAQEHCRSLEQCYREKELCASTLESQLEAARARGAALCADTRRVVRAVLAYTRRMRDNNREQENRIKELEALNRSLQQRNEDGLIKLTDPCSTKCLSLRSQRHSSRATETDDFLTPGRDRDSSCCKCMGRRDLFPQSGPSEISRCKCESREHETHDYITSSASRTGKHDCLSQVRFVNDRQNNSNLEERRKVSAKRSGSEMMSCDCSRDVGKEDRSRSGSEMASTSSAPTPPRRLMKKEFCISDDKVESWWWGGARRSAGVQQPHRRHAGAGADHAPARRSDHTGHRSDRAAGRGSDREVRYLHCGGPPPREASPSGELEARVGALQAALARAQTRWTRARTT